MALLPDMWRLPNVHLSICASDHLLRGMLIKGDALEATASPVDVETSKSSREWFWNALKTLVFFPPKGARGPRAKRWRRRRRRRTWPV